MLLRMSQYRDYTDKASLAVTERCLGQANRDDTPFAVALPALDLNYRYRSAKMQAVYLRTEEESR